MTLVNTRQAIAEYFTNAAIPNVGTVYAARPEILPEQAYVQTLLGEAVATTANGSSMVLVVNLPHTTRRRRADTGRGAVNDTLICDVAMELYFASTAGKGVPAQYDYDAIVDAMIALVRADATFAGRLWSVGEYTAGIDHEQSEPFTASDGLTICIMGVLKYEAWSWVDGNV